MKQDVFGQECIDNDEVDCKQCSNTTNTPVILVDGECKNCSSLFGEWCTKCNESNCEACADDQDVELVNGVCVDAANAFGEGCTSFNSTDKTKCGSVKSGYFIDGYSGIAVSCDALVDATLKDQCNSRTRSVVMSNTMLSGRDDSGIKVLYEGEETDATAVDPNCATWDSANKKCSMCKEGYITYGGMCKSCSEIHGESCTECTLSSCLKCSSGFVFHGVCKPCDEFTPHCNSCNDDGTCTSCSDNLYVMDGACVDCQTKVGDGCKECTVSAEDNSVTCAIGKCAADTCCSENNTKIIVKDNAMKCGTCSELDENCVECTSTECLSCKKGMAIDSDSGKCTSCSELFNSCAECDNDKCTLCSEDSWIKTPNGCYYEEQPIPPSSSLGKSSSTSAAVNPKSSTNDDEESGGSNGGMIAGIVIAVLVFVAIVGVAIYCFVTSGPKFGKIDESINEQDIEFESMSVL